ncbi:putative Pantothenate kinase subunit [Leptomonas pyrrhocoris]|uniref:Putative Pantothenate kinase subunit n=1 Tax=Leptomonas pyrrhocoris TaxID=157538 RepID=A0A0M9G9S3_LEPPY|nr:putative Pantothenate kinase subunit [Leptomonas pyrrhocoris]KPA85566.1 putative Pantothenate kinase subunit [Leptomonas pyrrhocoris]|eukprot:XP_015664005.1 putative Pantothenate kinase subunit [Leptomonas pyrrhocoris]
MSDAERSIASARVLSYNFNILPRGSGGYQHERIEAFLANVDAYDVLLLQEVYAMSYLPYALQKQFCYQKMLLDGLKEKGFHYYVISRQPSYRTILQYNVCSDNGLIIASRFPIWHRGSYTFRSHERREATVSKGCLFAEIELPAANGQGNQRVVVFNVHLRPEDNLPPESSQIQQVHRFVRAALAQVNGHCPSSPVGTVAQQPDGGDVPFIISGDFNIYGIDTTTGHTSKNFQDLLSQFQSLGTVRDVIYEAQGQNPPTRPASLYFPKLSKLERFEAIPQRQDYFFVNAAVQVDHPHLEKFMMGSRRPYTYLSDHFGTTCRITVAVDPNQVMAERSPSRLNVSSLVEAANHEHSNPTSNRRLEALLLAVAAWLIFTISFKSFVLCVFLVWVVMYSSQRYTSVPVTGEPPLVSLEALKETEELCMSNKALNPLAGVQTLGEMWERSVARFRTFKCLGATSELGEPEWMSYGAVDTRARELGAGLLEMGFRAGDLIGVECEPSRNAVILEVACALYGFTTVPLAGKRSTMRTLLDQNKIRAAVADRSAVAMLLSCRSTKLETVIYTNAFADEDDHMTAKDLNIAFFPFEYVEQQGRLHPVPPNTENVTTDSVLTYVMENTNIASCSDSSALLPVRHFAVLHDLSVLLMTGVLPSSYKQESMVWFSPMASLFQRICVMGMLSQGNAIATTGAAHLQETFVKFHPTLLVTSPALFHTSRLQLSRARRRYGAVYNWMFNAVYQLISRRIHINRQDSAALRFLFFRAFQRQLGGSVRKIILSVSQESTSFSLLEHIGVCYVPSVCEVSYQNCVGVTTIDGSPAPSLALNLKPLSALSDSAGIGQVVVTRKGEPALELQIAAQRKRDNTFTFLGAPLGVLWPVNFQYAVAVELEHTFAVSRYVNTIFVYCDPLKPVIAVVCPNRDTIGFEWYQAHPVEDTAKPVSWAELVNFGSQLIMEDFVSIAKEEKLHPSQIPQFVHLHPHAFSDHGTFLTPFGKIRRDVMHSYFASVFERLYAGASTSPLASSADLPMEMSDADSTTSKLDGASEFDLCVPATVDIGGTFAKVAFLMPPTASGITPFSSAIQEASSLSEKVGLRTFQYFADPEAAEKELRLNPHSRVGTLCFMKIPSQQIPRFAEHLASTHALTAFKPEYMKKLRATGGGAFKYSQLAQNELGVEFDVVKEIAAVVKGLNLVLRIAPESVFTVDPLTGVHHPHKLVSTGDTFSPFPYMLYNIGSGISFIKCLSADGAHTRVGGSPIGGATFWGLVRTMTNLTSWEEVMEIMRLDGPGDNRNVDLLVGDIYGYNAKDFPEMLSAEMVGSTFGKLGTERFYDMHRVSHTDHFADDDATSKILSPLASKAAASDFMSPVVRNGTRAASAIDIVRSMLNMIASNVTQLAYLHAKVHGVKNIFFAGGFVRDNPMLWSLISSAMKYWSSGDCHAHFLEHDGYLSALGCAMLDQQDPIKK